MLLENKTAIIYGAGGAVGGIVARAFAREGATVFLAGRRQQPLDIVAADVAAHGGKARTAIVDALDSRQIERHLEEVVTTAGGIDVSFNTIALGDIHGISLVESPEEAFLQPIATAAKTHFLTATAAARHMSKRRSGVILALTAQAARKPCRDVGGFSRYARLERGLE